MPSLRNFSLYLQSALDNGLTEHELDHVMIGYYNEEPVLILRKSKTENGWAFSIVKQDMIVLLSSTPFGLKSYLTSFII
jgi:hypothetical protein